MYFLDNNSGIATMPPLKETQSTTPLWFTEGDGHKGISWPGEDWFNIQQAEQLALLDAAGIRPDKGKLNQLTLAIRAIIGQEALLKTQALAEIAAAGKGAQEKARTHLGLGKLATQDGIQEATLHRKGIVQLSSATHSADATTAATPKAVNERVNAVVDNAPSDLDTLNKLAQAISNNPKFAESVTQLLSQKLAKNENGADIPDKNQFVKNLGLTETVDCAKNALDKRTGGTVNGPLTVEGAVNATAPDYLVKSGAIYDKANNVRNTQGLRLQGEGGQGSDIFFWEQIGKSAAMKCHVMSGQGGGMVCLIFTTPASFAPTAEHNLVAISTSHGAVGPRLSTKTGMWWVPFGEGR